MWTRNSSRDAEHSQDAADVVAPSATHPRDLQDESGQVTFRRSASAAGPSHPDPNFPQTMQQVVGELYEEKEQEQDDDEEHKDNEQDQADNDDERKDGDEEMDSSTTESEGTRLFHRVEDLVTDGQGGGRGRGQGRRRGRGPMECWELC